MTDNPHAISRRARTGIGVAFVALAMVVASALAGLGFASSTPSAAQYQYGKKVVICHHTGSKTHPWVTILIDIHAWPAHLQHGDTLGSCAGPQSPGKSQDGKVAVCHYTGSKTHPWVTLRINLHAWPAHLQHGDHLGPCGDSLPPTPVRHGKSKGHHNAAPVPKHGQGSKDDGNGSRSDHGSGGGRGRNK